MKHTRTVHKNHSSVTVPSTRTTAFIDGINLHKGILQLGWRLDYRRFRKWLADHYRVNEALIFVGYVPENRGLYQDFKNWGYSLVFRQISRGTGGNIKGNCDTELTLNAVAGCCENQFDKAVIVSGDGDFVSVTSFLAARGKLRSVIAAGYSSCTRNYRQCAFRPVLLQSFRDELEYRSMGTHDVVTKRSSSNSQSYRDCETLFRDPPDQSFSVGFSLPA